MKKLFAFVATVTAAFALAGVAQAGCMATVGLSSTPKAGHAAGKPWIVTIRVLQHGRTPMSDAAPEVRIRNAAGQLFVFKAKTTTKVGSYRARVVFPKAGRYSLGVYDGFPVKDCARVQALFPSRWHPTGASRRSHPPGPVKAGAGPSPPGPVRLEQRPSHTRPRPDRLERGPSAWIPRLA